MSRPIRYADPPHQFHDELRGFRFNDHRPWYDPRATPASYYHLRWSFEERRFAPPEFSKTGDNEDSFGNNEDSFGDLIIIE